jgi:hypothetical protein
MHGTKHTVESYYRARTCTVARCGIGSRKRAEKFGTDVGGAPPGPEKGMRTSA